MFYIGLTYEYILFLAKNQENVFYVKPIEKKLIYFKRSLSVWGIHSSAHLFTVRFWIQWCTAKYTGMDIKNENFCQKNGNSCNKNENFCNKKWEFCNENIVYL